MIYPKLQFVYGLSQEKRIKYTELLFINFY
jgi:hypothetical protein